MFPSLRRTTQQTDTALRENRKAALRELIEETGYGGEGEGAGKATVEEVSPLLVSPSVHHPFSAKSPLIDGVLVPSRSLIQGKHSSNPIKYLNSHSWGPRFYPSLTTANMVLATVRVKLAESDPEPKQKLDEGEHIVKRVVEVSELYNVLQGGFPASRRPCDLRFSRGEWSADGSCGIEYNKKGFTIDARLAHWAMGWHMAVRSDKK